MDDGSREQRDARLKNGGGEEDDAAKKCEMLVTGVA